MGVLEQGTGTEADEGEGLRLDSVTGMGAPVMLKACVRDLERGDVLANRYQIEAVIGSGGSGRVLRAFDRVSRTPVALKILRPEFAEDPVWTERFSRELRVGRHIQHPNVCRVFDFDDADGHKFLSMELATGGTIRRQLYDAAEAERSWSDRVADARSVIAGVVALHTAGITHRDLKPDNILRMEDGRLVVSDFGLATDPGAGPATTIMVGTPTYMAPEVVMGDPATKRADVWALGVVLHEILFGRRPQWKNTRPGHRRYFAPELATPAERRLAELCGRAADDAPEARPESAIELLREFDVARRGRRSARAVRRDAVWGALALATIGGLLLVKDRWTNRAQASSSEVAASVGMPTKVLQPTGVPADWSKGSTRLAEFDGRVHCFSLNHDRDTARVIWGEPRRAEDIDVRTGRRGAAKLLPETFESGCPQTAPDGRGLLFEKTVDGAQHVFLSASPDGNTARQLVRGGSPLWLPNGQEFSFTLDSRHAAVFSIPTRAMTVVADDVGKQFAIDDQTIDPSGNRLAVLYATDSFGGLLVVHTLPGLEVVGRAQVPQWARNLRFGRANDVLFTMVGTNGTRELVAADLSGSSLHRLARVPGRDVRDYSESGSSEILVTRKLRFDLWRGDDIGRAKPLTTDGQSVNGALSSAGKLLIQRRLTDAREVIVLRDKTGTEEQMTQGPTDLTPAFLPDGTTWIYTKLDSGEIVKCSVTTRSCTPIYSDPLVPGFAIADPSGQKIAYITVLNAPRVRIISSLGKDLRDFGPALACTPIWDTGNRLWVAVSAEKDTRTWAEIDTDSGQRTGDLRSAHVTEGGDECPPPIGVRVEGSAQIVSVMRETADLSRIDNIDSMPGSQD